MEKTVHSAAAFIDILCISNILCKKSDEKNNTPMLIAKTII